MKKYKDTLCAFVVNYARFIGSILLVFITTFLCVALYSHNADDYTWLWQSDVFQPITNYAGIVGAYVSCTLFYFFGSASFFLVLLFLGMFLVTVSRRSYRDEWERLVSLLGLMVVSATLLTISEVDFFLSPYPGGLVGYAIYTSLVSVCERGLIYIILCTMMTIFLLLISRFSFLFAIRGGAYVVRALFERSHYARYVFQKIGTVFLFCVRPICFLIRIGYDLVASTPEEAALLFETQAYDVDSSIYQDPVWRQWIRGNQLKKKCKAVEHNYFSEHLQTTGIGYDTSEQKSVDVSHEKKKPMFSDLSVRGCAKSDKEKSALLASSYGLYTIPHTSLFFFTRI